VGCASLDRADCGLVAAGAPPEGQTFNTGVAFLLGQGALDRGSPIRNGRAFASPFLVGASGEMVTLTLPFQHTMRSASSY
jgi:hypothetical protein